MSVFQEKPNSTRNEQPADAADEMTESQLDEVSGGVKDGTSNTVVTGERKQGNDIIAILIG